MSFPNWFLKKSDEGRQKYCNKHPNSEVCIAFFGLNRGSSNEFVEYDHSQKKQEVAKVAGTPVVHEAVASKVDEKKAKGELDHHYYDTKNNYAWAKKSNVKNLGEDIEGSKRHTRNMFREWGDFTTPDSLAVIMSDRFDHKHLKKHGAVQLATKNREVAPNYWIILKILDTYPAFNAMKMDKLQWAKDYHYLLEEGKKIADRHPGDIKSTHKEFIKFIIDFLHENKVYKDMAYDLYKPFLHKNSPIHKLLEHYGMRPSRYIEANNIVKFDELLNAKDEVKDNIVEVLSGKSVTEVLGIKGPARDNFKPEVFYNSFIPGRVEDLEFKNFDEVRDFFSNSDFKIRGLQFGNSLRDKEREQFAIISAVCLKDLANVLELPPQLITGNGSIGIAIGARGSGGALAHYEPAYTVINFSKNGGGGAFAHEMGHFLDNLVGRTANYAKTSDLLSRKAVYSSLDPDLADYKNDLDKINSKVVSRIQNTDGYRSCSRKMQDWAKDKAECFARAFEAYVAKKASEKGINNSYLVSLPKHFFWPTEEELDEYSAVFDKFFSILKNRVGTKQEEAKQAIAG